MSNGDFIFETAEKINDVYKVAFKEGHKIGFKEGFRKAIEKYAGCWIVGEDNKTLEMAIEEAEKECLTTQ